ncbi:MULTISPECIES: NAD(+) diphosphatase [unclassified Janthinobacterium]|uniref:NAD(+) diphosphatase n=1 Tax=unclassified Janthinobacterium TaxID=2610881 RepID=UPI00034BAA6A|nr:MULTISPECIES: NAD(+) diphosphatase [unclassified Janthinobacterium]MEC5163438.1 NAD+ diphosphatase [Janthinobacterium sp. CG_S6]
MLQTPASFTALTTPQAHADALTFVFHGNRLLLRSADLALPDAAALAALGVEPAGAHPVGLWDGRYCQALALADDALADPGYAFHGLRALFGAVDDGLLGLAGRANQIVEWARTHRYCGACATPMALAPGERCYQCPACGMAAYPRISPAMMVLIRKGDAVLLALHTASPSKRYSPLAGFLEAGESIEEAVHREVMEEVGLRVHNLEYFMSQSWPFPHSLMIAFTADYLDGEIRVDEDEIAEARWFGPVDEWPESPSAVSISALLVDAHRPRR